MLAYRGACCCCCCRNIAGQLRCCRLSASLFLLPLLCLNIRSTLLRLCNVSMSHMSFRIGKRAVPHPWGPHQRGCEGGPQGWGWFRNALCMVKLRRVSLCPVFSWQMQAGSGLCMNCQQPDKQCHCCGQICLSALAFAMDAQASVEVMAIGPKSLSWTWEQHQVEQKVTPAVQPESRCMPRTDGQMHTW